MSKTAIRVQYVPQYLYIWRAETPRWVDAYKAHSLHSRQAAAAQLTSFIAKGTPVRIVEETVTAKVVLGTPGPAERHRFEVYDKETGETEFWPCDVGVPVAECRAAAERGLAEREGQTPGRYGLREIGAPTHG